MKQLPTMTNKLISNLSCDETEFNKASITYEAALKNSGYQRTLKFKKPSKNTRQNQNSFIDISQEITALERYSTKAIIYS